MSIVPPPLPLPNPAPHHQRSTFIHDFLIKQRNNIDYSIKRRYKYDINDINMLIYYLSSYPQNAWKLRHVDFNDDEIVLFQAYMGRGYHLNEERKQYIPIGILYRYATIPFIRYTLEHHPHIISAIISSRIQHAAFPKKLEPYLPSQWHNPTTYIYHMYHLHHHIKIRKLKQAQPGDLCIPQQNKAIHWDINLSTLDKSSQSPSPSPLIFCPGTCVFWIISHGAFPFYDPTSLFPSPSPSPSSQLSLSQSLADIHWCQLVTWSHCYHSEFSSYTGLDLSSPSTELSLVSACQGLMYLEQKWKPYIQHRTSYLTQTCDTLYPDLIHLILDYIPISSHIHDGLQVLHHLRTSPLLCEEILEAVSYLQHKGPEPWIRPVSKPRHQRKCTLM